MQQQFSSINAEESELERQEDKRDKHLSEPDEPTAKDRTAMKAQDEMAHEKSLNYGAGHDSLKAMLKRVWDYGLKHGPSAAHREYGIWYLQAEDMYG